MRTLNPWGELLLGLVIGGFGVVYVFNLFGMAEEHAQRTRRRLKWMDRVPPWNWIRTPDPHEADEVRRARTLMRIPMIGFAIVGMILVWHGISRMMQGG